jgi:alcohol dehydrogenase class IV
MAVTAGIGDATPEGFLRWLADLKATLGVPRSLVDTDVEPSAQERLVEVAMADSCHLNNPRPITRGDIEAIFTRAFS